TPQPALPAPTTTLTSSRVSGTGPVVFTATVRSSNATVPTGRVVFVTAGAVLGTAWIVNGKAVLGVMGLPRGTHRIFSVFLGAPLLNPSVSPALVQRVGLALSRTARAKARKAAATEREAADGTRSPSV
ncbi:Ig-like domain-containing protein, partial [Streptosporangium sp. OZ121]|uniref:Ig-like domain-containing protein n=1 Tax=Streptosporangium sp. OZ121 TaxID=3444183 RepID=UPI003F7B1D91